MSEQRTSPSPEPLVAVTISADELRSMKKIALMAGDCVKALPDGETKTRWSAHLLMFMGVVFRAGGNR